jgi:hypothetical protein
MPALVIFGLRLLHLAVYAEAVVIVILLLVVAWLYVEVTYYFDLYQEARGACAEARRTLEAVGNMSQIRRDTAERMARADQRRRS